MAEVKTEEEVKVEQEKVDQKIDDVAEKVKQDAEDKGLSPEETKREVEKARKEEKDKLYPTIEGLKKDLKDIQKILKAEQDEKEKMRREAEEKTERERQNTLTDQERITELLNKLEEQLKTERVENRKFKEELEERDHRAQLRSYRERLIAAHQDEIIPELIKGDSIEELDEALEIAKARFKEFEERFKQSRSETTRKNMGRTSTNPDYEALEDEELSRDLRSLDQDKYLKDENYRQQIQAELANEYARLSGRR